MDSVIYSYKSAEDDLPIIRVEIVFPQILGCIKYIVVCSLKAMAKLYFLTIFLINLTPHTPMTQIYTAGI